MTTRTTARVCAFLAPLLLWASNSCFSVQPDANDMRTTHSVRIGQQDFPLTFGKQNVTEDVKHSIAVDLSLSFSTSTSIVLRASERSRVDEWHGYPVTHTLCELRGGKFHRLNRVTYPFVIREQFGYAVTISNELYLIINEELLAAYTDTLNAADKHPTMLTDLKKYLALLQDSAELEKIARDQEQARDFVYCYRVSLDTGLSLFRSYVRDISTGYNMTIKPPSLLDIVSLRRGFKDEDAPDDVYIVSAVISGRETPASEPFAERLPLGAYVDDKWRLFAWPMP